ncbi:MAG: glycosyltransferase family 2 protein [Armatimonadota bacterium]
MKPELISIVLPVHNGERYLRESVESCLAQTWENIELIVVDDASTDSTAEIVRSYDDPRIRLITNSRNLGLPASLNAGFAAAAGEFFTWTSDDNLYAPDGIAALVEGLRNNPRAALAYGSFYLIDEQGRVIGKKDCPPPAYLPRENVVGAYFVYRRETAEAVGPYDPDMRLAEDYDYWLRMYRRFPIVRCDADGYYYRVHSASLTGTSRERDILEVARLAQRRHVTARMRLRCLVYSAVDPVAGALSRSVLGSVLRPFGRWWRAFGGRHA